MKDNAVAYTTEEFELLKKLYEEKGTERIDEIAREMNRPVRSIRAKLVNAQIYVPIEKPATRRKTLSKKELLNKLQDIVGFDTTGFNGSTKTVLADLLEFLKENK